MPILVSNQAYIFLCSITGGAIMAFIYDIFRIKRKAIRTAGLIVQIEDFAYWILVAIVMFLVVFYSNEGELRGYIFLGSIMGVVLYMLILSRIIMNSSLFIIRVASRMLKTFWMIISYPFKLLFKLLSYPAGFITKVARKSSKRMKNAGRITASRVKLRKRIFKNARNKI